MSAFIVSFEVEEVAVIWELLRVVQLGDRNKYETAISNLCIDLEKSGIEERLNEYYKLTETKAPDIWVEANSDCGVTIKLE